MTEPVKYVPFGGAQVPESAKREVIDRNGQKIYCVWTDDKGGKVTYPEQHADENQQRCYMRSELRRDTSGHIYFHETYIPKGLYEEALNDSRADISYSNGERVSASFWTSKHLYNDRYYQSTVDNTPAINISTDSGMVYDTQNVTLSNMRGATVTGSTDEDNITLTNSSNCTVDVSNANNNTFVSDNVKVVNGQGNKVKAGDHDQVTFRTFNYETATETTQANHKGEGTYKQ